MRIFQAALDSSLVERGALQALEVLGAPEAFWRDLDDTRLERMAQSGNASAQAEWAWRLATSESGPAALAQALDWASRAAERGDPAGQAVLGWLLYHGQGIPQDHPEAARLFGLAAAAHDLRGLCWRGLCLLRGHGIDRDPVAARPMLEAAAQRNARLAQY